MRIRRLINIILICFWVFLFMFVFLTFFKIRLPDFGAWFSSLRRVEEPPARLIPRKDIVDFSCSFRDPSDLRFWSTSGASMEIASGIHHQGDSWVRVNYLPTASPSFHLKFDETGITDWRGVEKLAFRVYNPQGWEVSLKVKIKDTAENSYQRNVDIPPFQIMPVEIPVENVARQLDASRINYLNLFLWEPATETRLFFTDFVFLGPVQAKPLSSEVFFSGLEFPLSVLPGQKVVASFYFTPQGRIEADWELLIRLRRGEAIHTLKQTEIPFPTSRWPAGRLSKVGPLDLTIPDSLSPGNYDLEVILVQESRSEGRLRYIFQPYGNPGLEDQRVATIQVTTPTN